MIQHEELRHTTTSTNQKKYQCFACNHTPSGRCRYRYICSLAVRLIVRLQVARSDIQEQSPVYHLVGSCFQSLVQPNVLVAYNAQLFSLIPIQGTVVVSSVSRIAGTGYESKVPSHLPVAGKSRIMSLVLATETS